MMADAADSVQRDLSAKCRVEQSVAVVLLVAVNWWQIAIKSS